MIARRCFLLALLAAQAAGAGESADLLQKLDSLHRHRDEAGVSAELRATLERGLKESPDAFELLWRAARERVWAADGATDSRLKKQLGKEAWAYGEKAAQKNPERIEGHYYGALGIGLYSQAVGIMKALSEGLEGKFNAYSDRALALDAGYELSGPRVMKGRYYYELPWPKRNLGKATKWLEEAIRSSPGAVRAYLYLAEAQLADGEEEKAKATLEKLAALPGGMDPPEERRVKGWARAVEAKVNDALD